MCTSLLHFDITFSLRLNKWCVYNSRIKLWVVVFWNETYNVSPLYVYECKVTWDISSSQTTSEEKRFALFITKIQCKFANLSLPQTQTQFRNHDIVCKRYGSKIVFVFKEIFFLFHQKKTPLISSTYINNDACISLATTTKINIKARRRKKTNPYPAANKRKNVQNKLTLETSVYIYRCAQYNILKL